MIIRERLNELVMIAQHDHASVSGVLAENMKDSLFQGLSARKSVEIAIREHDRAWIPVDKHPIINDETQLPFTFMDFPISYKGIIYKHGIDEVARMDSYAALLCSAHYVQFMTRNKDEHLARLFLEGEKDRKKHLESTLLLYDENEFQFHFNLLKFCDDVSLYMCLNEPGISKEDEHPFYRDGIHNPFEQGQRIKANWKDPQTIQLSTFPFKKPFNVSLKQKVVPKGEIVNKGIAKAYHNARLETIEIRFTVE